MTSRIYFLFLTLTPLLSPPITLFKASVLSSQNLLIAPAPKAVHISFKDDDDNSYSCSYVFKLNFLRSLATQKKTVNEEDLDKLKKFTEDFGQEG